MTARDLAAYLIGLFEGRRLKVYRDSQGIPTVGRGHRVVPADGLKVGDVITPEREEAFFEADLDTAHVRMRGLAAKWKPYQEAAIWSLAFNAGKSPFVPGTGLRAALQGDDVERVSNIIRLYCNGRNKETGKLEKVPGLVKRREVEAHVFDLDVTLNLFAWGLMPKAVKAVQACLFLLGFDPGPIDGAPGPKTRRALQAFQKDRGIRPPHDFDADYNNPLRDAVEEKLGVVRRGDVRQDGAC